MAIRVVGFDNVQVVDFSPNPASGSLFLITGVAKIEFRGSTTPDSDGWTRDTCSFDVPTPRGQPFLFKGAVVRASALVVPATVQNVGSADIGFGVDHTSAVVSDPINGQCKVTLTSLVVTRNTQGIVWRLAFQANVNALAVAPATITISGPTNISVSITQLRNNPIVRRDYSIDISRLSPPLSIQWTGGAGTTIANPTASSTAIDFDLRGDGVGDVETFPLSVQVTDQLGESVSSQQVTITVTT